MMDTIFMASSPWMNDLWLQRDGQHSSGSSLTSELLFDPLELESERSDTELNTYGHPAKIGWDYPSFGTDLTELASEVNLPNSDVSVANSECSDEYSVVDVEADLEETVDLLGFLDRVSAKSFSTSAVLENSSHDPSSFLIGDELDKEDDEDLQTICVNPSQWPEDVSDEESQSKGERYSAITEICAQETVSTSASLSFSKFLDQTVHWKTLSTELKQDVVEQISLIISTQLGVREQVEVLRAIFPDDSSSSLLTDCQVIDVTCIDDDKFKQVQRLLKEHLQQSQQNCSCQGSASPNSGRAHRRSHHGEKSHCHNSNQSKCICGGGRETSMTNALKEEASAKNRLKAHRRQPVHVSAKQRRLQQRKRNRQELKEKRSGLFVKEEVLAVNIGDDGYESEEDVDILA